jgi:hypothetical protein
MDNATHKFSIRKLNVMPARRSTIKITAAAPRRINQTSIRRRCTHNTKNLQKKITHTPKRASTPRQLTTAVCVRMSVPSGGSRAHLAEMQKEKCNYGSLTADNVLCCV